MAERLPLFVGVDTVKFDLGVSRAKAYEVIKLHSVHSTPQSFIGR